MRLKRLLLMTLALLAAMAVSFNTAAFADTEKADADVMINGNYLAFASDSLPCNVSGRIMVPYRAIFEYLGADVDYDAATGAISGSANGLKLTMYNGVNTISITRADGSADQLTMDVAPFIKNGRTFVPTRFVSEVLGYSVGWDSEYKTVIIIDTASAAEELADKLTILEKTRKLVADKNITYSVIGTIDMALSGEDDLGVSSSTVLSGAYKGVTRNSSKDLTLYVKSAVDNGKAEDLELSIKHNALTGDLLIQGDSVTEKNQWMKVNTRSFYEDSGIDMETLLGFCAGSGAVDTDLMLGGVFADNSDEYSIFSYLQMQASNSCLAELMGDDAFERSGNTYSTKIDAEAFRKALATAAGDAGTQALGIDSPEDYEVTGGLIVDVDSNDQAVDYDFRLKVINKKTGVNILVHHYTDGLYTEFSITMKEGENSMAYDTVTKLTKTSEKLNLSIPSGDSVIDVNELFSSLIG